MCYLKSCVDNTQYNEQMQQEARHADNIAGTQLCCRMVMALNSARFKENELWYTFKGFHRLQLACSVHM